MSSATRGVTLTGVHSVHAIEQLIGFTYAALMVAVPSESVSCRTPAGIHSARDGGRTQAVVSLRMVKTPFAAHAS
jgi:hypothetical protein